MSTTDNVLILGASYGSLLATKLLLAGYAVTLVCLPAEAELINKQGTRVRLPIRDRERDNEHQILEIDSRRLAGTLSATTPQRADLSEYELVVLAMQEPQYRLPGVRELLDSVATSRIPCMSIMNMPPPPYLARIPGIDIHSLRRCYTSPEVWDSFDPALMTLCSPDPQAVRPPEEGTNVLHVGLPTNFKAARFESDEHTAILRRIQIAIEAIRYDTGKGKIELPVKLKVHDSMFVPLAKWSMLLAGNYRCIGKSEMASIRDTVHGNIELSRSIYNWVGDVCRTIGASKADLVPFEKYANAAHGLAKASSAARALLAGAPYIERADCLVKAIAAQKGMQCEAVDQTVALVDEWLRANREKA